jgi:ketosteroid isomerase-like protein
MTATENVHLILEIFDAIERRDAGRVFSLCDPAVEFLWRPSLPYAGREPGAWADTWAPLQRTEAARRLDPRVVGATEDEVVVLWQQRAVSPAGEGLDTPVLAIYQIRDGKLARAQMFYFDPVGVNDFLARANRQLQTDSERAHPDGIREVLGMGNRR